ncbi:precorrin-6A reductase [Lachnospiraceae bacterium 45-W7]
MREILVFSGTSEGRQLAVQLAENGVCVTVCVATEYGREVMEQEGERPLLQVRTGRLDALQMEELLVKRQWEFVVDATHPFAVEASKNIAKACERRGLEVLRLLREEEREAENFEEADITYADSPEQAAAYLNRTEGNIFLTTGSKELAEYVKGIQDISRLYARILPTGAEVENCRRLGLKGKQIICMQGPFSRELNAAMMKEIHASVLVTKETSRAGGFSEKVEAAVETGAAVVVIRRPRETGYSMQEILKRTGVRWQKRQSPRQVVLAGMGMGSLSNMTREVYQACQDADLIIGAERMLETVRDMGKPLKSLCQSGEIAAYIRAHCEYSNIVVLLSGDVGFYSGAKKLRQELLKRKETTAEGAGEEDADNLKLRQLCGVPTVVYFASRLGISWENLALFSLHGRRQNLIGKLQSHGKIFALTDGAEGIRNVSGRLLQYGFSRVKMYVGYMLSYPQEEIYEGRPQDFLDYRKEGVSAMILLNEEEPEFVVTSGIPDQEFLRGKAPMTKEEVRSISLSKLALTRDAVVYDIGSGTGSIAVECARHCPDGTVYAIEKKTEALELLTENKFKHRVSNLEIVQGEAPLAMEELPPPTHAFIGGSGGRLSEIIRLLWKKNPAVRLVLNVISLKTLGEVMELMKNTAFSHKEIVYVSVAKEKELRGHFLMLGQNPVYVITLQK